MKKITLEKLKELKKLPHIILYYRINDSEEVETLTQYKLIDLFDQTIDKTFERVTIAGTYYDSSLALQKINPISYCKSLKDYARSEGWLTV
jgi:hypothetical protein